MMTVLGQTGNPTQHPKLGSLQEGDGQKTVNVQFMDNAGLTSTNNYTLTLLTPQPTVAPRRLPAQLLPHCLPNLNLPHLFQHPILQLLHTPNPTQITEPKTIPEAPEWILILIVLSTLMLALLFKKNRKSTLI